MTVRIFTNEKLRVVNMLQHYKNWHHVKKDIRQKFPYTITFLKTSHPVTYNNATHV